MHFEPAAVLRLCAFSCWRFALLRVVLGIGAYLPSQTTTHAPAIASATPAIIKPSSPSTRRPALSLSHVLSARLVFVLLLDAVGKPPSPIRDLALSPVFFFFFRGSMSPTRGRLRREAFSRHSWALEKLSWQAFADKGFCKLNFLRMKSHLAAFVAIAFRRCVSNVDRLKFSRV